MRGKLLLIGLLISLVLLVAACDTLGTAVDDCSGGGALFQDTFDGERNCGWALYNQSGSVVEIDDEAGVLRLTTSQPGQIWWTNPGQNFDDVIINVEAQQVSGPNNNAYGVICRYQNENNFYVFLISGDGFFAIGKYQSGSDQVTYLTPDEQYQFSDAINQGVAANQLRASCIGDELSLSVNGIPLYSVTDPTFVTGDVGIALSTFEPGTAVVEFGDFRVFAP